MSDHVIGSWSDSDDYYLCANCGKPVALGADQRRLINILNGNPECRGRQEAGQ